MSQTETQEITADVLAEMVGITNGLVDLMEKLNDPRITALRSAHELASDPDLDDTGRKLAYGMMEAMLTNYLDGSGMMKRSLPDTPSNLTTEALGHHIAIEKYLRSREQEQQPDYAGSD